MNGAMAAIRRAVELHAISIYSVILVASLVLLPAPAGAEDEEFSITVDIVVPANDYIQWELVVTNGQTVRIQLAAEQGTLSFYFMEPADYSDFLSAREDPQNGEFGCVSGLSIEDAAAINKSSVIDISGVYYFVVVNDGPSDGRVSGVISTLYSGDDLLFAIFLVLLIVGVVVVAFLVFAYASRKDLVLHPPPSTRVGEGRYSAPSTPSSYQPQMDKTHKIGSVCPSCRKPVPEEALQCPKCGARQH